jgi:hypothetical protein
MILVLVPTKARQLESESQEPEPLDLTLKPDTLTTLVQTLPSHNIAPLLIKGFPIVPRAHPGKTWFGRSQHDKAKKTKSNYLC